MNALLRIAGVVAGPGPGAGAGGGRAQWLDRRFERWPMRHLVVTGEFRQVSDTRVRSVVLPRVQRGFFAVDLERLRADLACAAVGRAVEVRKRWPDRLEVTRGRTPPAGALGRHPHAGGERRAVRRHRKRHGARLPLFEGPDDRALRDDRLSIRTARPLFLAQRPAGARQCGCRARGSWSLRLSDGTEVAVGRSDPRHRLERFVAAAAATCVADEPRRLARADLRYTNGFALVWLASPTPAPAAPDSRTQGTHESQRRQVADRRPRHRHLEGDGAGWRVLARPGNRGDRHRLARIARHEARRGGGHRVHRAVDPARDRRGRADGRLRDPLVYASIIRQPHASAAIRRASCRWRAAKSPTPTSTACSRRPRRWRCRPTRRSCTRSRRNTSSTTRRKASAIPVGMSGVRLEVRAHLVTGAQSAAQNITKCVQRCGLQVDDLILSSLASSTAVLTADERELGVVLVDIGAGTTDIAVFVQGAIRHTRLAADRRRPGHQRHRPPAAHADARSRADQGPLRLRAGAAGDRRRNASRCRASATVRRAGWRARPWPRRCRTATRKSSRWCRPNCAAPASRSWCAPAWCSPAAPRAWKAWSSWPKKCCTCRCAWAFRSTSRGLGEVVGNPVHATGVGLLLWGSQLEHPRRPTLSMPARPARVWTKFKNWYRGEF